MTRWLFTLRIRNIWSTHHHHILNHWIIWQLNTGSLKLEHPRDCSGFVRSRCCHVLSQHQSLYMDLFLSAKLFVVCSRVDATSRQRRGGRTASKRVAKPRSHSHEIIQSGLWLCKSETIFIFFHLQKNLLVETRDSLAVLVLMCIISSTPKQTALTANNHMPLPVWFALIRSGPFLLPFSLLLSPIVVPSFTWAPAPLLPSR
jgi:hypothetical protein